ncbi:hypothetical protein J2T09_000696 [Neorhizobium huautlense]|uniref:DUF2934 domain-containing protein n=1 Tax=Neorhizobium huautlense TaxID=67774 RepID=A0ABT9PQ33_9HYPH|nr:hypothetical protein [Neorhizobium huautlense]
MAESEHEWISKRAYALWEEEGYPTGKDNEHWDRARQEYLLFAPLGVTKGLPKGKKPKANGAAPEKVAAKKPEAVAKTAKPKAAKADAKSVDAKPAAAEPKPAPAKSAPAKPAAKAAKPAKAKAIAAEAKPAAKTRSKKLTAK